jgi:hypothetical protein
MDFVLRKIAQEYALLGTQSFAGFRTGTTPSSSNSGTPSNTPLRIHDIQDLLESLNIIKEIPLQGH